ncbi:hypothetical protein ACFZCG_10940 [Streptomyces tanashiensis]
MTGLTDAVNGLPRILGHAYPDAIRKTDAQTVSHVAILASFL